MIMIGCDFHPGLQELALLDTGRRREQWPSHAFGPGPVREFYASLTKPVRVGLEASGYSQWFEEMLEELGIELWVGDPARAEETNHATKERSSGKTSELRSQTRLCRAWKRPQGSR